MKYLIISLVILLIPSVANAVILAQEDFETIPVGDIRAVNYDGADNNVTTALLAHGFAFVSSACYVVSATTGQYCPQSIISTIGHNGTTTKVLRYDYRGSESQAVENRMGNLTHYLSSGQMEIWERYYYRTLPANGVGTSDYGGCDANSAGTKHHYWKSTYMAPGLMTNMWCSRETAWTPVEIYDCNPVYRGGTGCPNYYLNMPPATPLVDNVWYCKELHIKFNSSPTTSDGMFEYFIDGVLKGGWYDRQFVGPDHWPDLIDRTQFYRQDARNMFRDEDDWIVATTRTETGGCGGTSQDLTPPNIPTGVSVR